MFVFAQCLRTGMESEVSRYDQVVICRFWKKCTYGQFLMRHIIRVRLIQSRGMNTAQLIRD